MRGHIAVSLLILGLLMASSSALANVKVFASSATGIGIRKQGPLEATEGTIMKYTITVYNLGDLTIYNITVTDVFPNRTSSEWTVDHLAPAGQLGASFTISGIACLADLNDVLPIYADNPCVINNARVDGYVYVQNATLSVHADTQFATRVLAIPVGGYAFTPKVTDQLSPVVIYPVLILLMTIAFTTIRHGGASSRGVTRRLKDQESQHRNLDLSARAAPGPHGLDG